MQTHTNKHTHTFYFRRSFSLSLHSLYQTNRFDKGRSKINNYPFFHLRHCMLVLSLFFSLSLSLSLSIIHALNHLPALLISLSPLSLLSDQLSQQDKKDIGSHFESLSLSLSLSLSFTLSLSKINSQTQMQTNTHTHMNTLFILASLSLHSLIN